MKRFFYFLLSVSGLLISFGCSTNSIYMPDQIFFLPETSGNFLKGDIGTGIRSMTRITVFNDINANPPTSSGAEIKGVGPMSIEASAIGLTGSLGILEYLDIVYINGFGLKLGTKRDSDGWKFSASAVQERFSFGPPLGTDGFSAKVNKASVIGSAGYRFNPTQLLYFSYIREWFDVNSAVNKDQQLSFSIEDHGVHERWNVGYEFATADKIHLLFEGSFTYTQFPRAESHAGQSAGIAAKRYW